MTELTFSVRMGAPEGPRQFADATLVVEEAGFDQVWVGNDLFSTSGLVAIAAAGYATSRIHVGSGVLDGTSLHPAQIASFASYMQRLTDGRYLLGMGAGVDAWFERAGIPHDSVLARTRRTVIEVRELLAGRSPAGLPYVTPGWKDSGRLEPGTARETPIYIAGMGPKILETAGRYADGAMPLSLPPESYFFALENIERGAAAAGRSTADMDIMAALWIDAVEPEEVPEARARAMRRVANFAGSFSPESLERSGLDPEAFANTGRLWESGDRDGATASVTEEMSRMVIWGTVDDVVERCVSLIEKGVRHISLSDTVTEGFGDRMARYRDSILPILRDAAR